MILIFNIVSNAKVKPSTSESLFWQMNMNHCLFVLVLIFFGLSFPLLLEIDFFLKLINLLLQIVHLDLIHLEGFCVLSDLFFHCLSLFMFLFKCVIIDWYHFLLLDWRLPFQNLLKLFELFVLLTNLLYLGLHIVVFWDQSSLDGLNFCHQLISQGVCGFELSPSVNIHWIL